ncbi:MAG TPA: hypothetical protein VE077_16980 [Candidatus Methylomirabilis sp.]|nr:hypothetical protein [Candidatus Methylomirabilis sp.]
MTASDQPAQCHSQCILFVLFLLSLPFLNPWVRGDGVGYYAFARAPLIQHNLDFTPDYQHANPSFRENRLDANGQPVPEFRTPTGHLDNHFTVGPAILWSPFLLLAHAAVLLARSLGSAIPADGFSTPYRVAMAFATALYGFLGLLLSFRLARKYVEDRWAFLATIALWGAGSLPVYMYFNPSWSHAHSAFAVALFLFYWHKTRDNRSLPQWLALGAIGGLMLDVYYANAMALAVLPFEATHEYKLAFRRATPDTPHVSQLFARHLAFFIALVACLLPTLITRRIIYGRAFESGYVPVGEWNWLSPHLLSVLFSSDHGLLSWTPILLFALVGLIVFWRSVPRVGAAFLLIFLAFYYFIASYPDWAGISSYGNRFFVSLTPLFIVGLAFLLDRFSRFFRTPRVAHVVSSLFLAFFVIWNAGLMFQWGAHLIPARGPISFPEMIHNQFTAVPKQLATQLESYFLHRKTMMQQIEQRDLEQLKSNPPPP